MKSKKKFNEKYNQEFEWLIDSAIWELTFENLRVEHLLNVLDEVRALTDDKLIKKIIDHEKERDNLDKLAHTRAIFWF